MLVNEQILQLATAGNPSMPSSAVRREHPKFYEFRKELSARREFVGAAASGAITMPSHVRTR